MRKGLEARAGSCAAAGTVGNGLWPKELELGVLIGRVELCGKGEKTATGGQAAAITDAWAGSSE